MHTYIDPYAICAVQSYWENYNPNLKGNFLGEDLKNNNLQKMKDYIDACFYVGAYPAPVKLICFPEFAIGGLYNPKTTTEEVKKYQAISIPGPETEVLADKAKEHNIYIAASNHENDQEIPHFFFNTAFIINPKGKIILKYRKLNVQFGCNPHDIMDKYTDPITGKPDPFPVVDTKIGRLSCFICGDLGIPEIPKIFALKGADVLLHLSSGYSWELALQNIRVRANDNTIYIVHENWAARVLTTQSINGERVITSVDSRGGGGSMIVDYNGNIIAKADGNSPQLVMGYVDIEKLRLQKKKWKSVTKGEGNFLAYTRTELYSPYYNKTIFPPNKVLKEGPMERQSDESVTKRREEAVKNLEKFLDYYNEDDVS